MAWKLPPPREFGWKLKPLESARTSFDISPENVFHLRIEHDRIRGVTPKMLYWWFQNIGGDMTYQGRVYPRYLVWHPYDHIHWALARNTRPDGSIGVGSYFRIVEAFNADLNMLIDSVEQVVKLDETGIRLVRRIGGTEVFSLEHWFEADGADCRYRSHMVVGAESWFGRAFFNPLIRPRIFTQAMGAAWLKHNIEEVGAFENFLPEFYASMQRK